MKRIALLILTLVTSMAAWDADAAVTATTWAELGELFTNASTDADAPTEVILGADITAGAGDTYFTLSGNRHLVLDLNGHTIDRNMSEVASDGYVIHAKTNSSLTIRDSSPEQTGTITGGWGNSNVGCIASYSATLRLEGGTITGNRVHSQGGSAVSFSGTFYMTGGTITGNIANTTNYNYTSCGAVYFSNTADFYMSGGTITGNYCGTTEYGSAGLGFYLGMGNKNVHLSGSYTLSGNMQGTYDATAGTWSNLQPSDYLNTNRCYIRIDDTIDPPAPLVMVLYSGYYTDFTRGWSTFMEGKDPENYFTLLPYITDRGIGVVDGEATIGTLHTITLGDNITASATSAALGRPVTLSYNGDVPEDYQLEYSVTIDGSDPAETVEVTLGDDGTYSFVMPDADVTVSVTVSKIPVTTSYVDADGASHTVEAIPLDNTMTTLAAGTYVVNSNVTFTQTVTTTGDVTLILADGKTMSIGTENNPLPNGNGIDSPNNLTIYGQSLGLLAGGTLEIYTNINNGIQMGYDKAYAQHSGKVFIWNHGGPCITNGNITLDGGILDVKNDGSDNGDIAYVSRINILGGVLYARNGGLHAGGGITLGCKTSDDIIYAISYNNSPVTIATGQALVYVSNDEKLTVVGSLDNYTISGPNGIAGKYLTKGMTWGEVKTDLEAGNSVTLMNDIIRDGAETISITGSATIDLNGYTVQGRTSGNIYSGHSIFQVADGGSLTVTDGSTDKDGGIASVYDAPAIAVSGTDANNYGSLTLAAGSIGYETPTTVAISGYGKFTMTGGSVDTYFSGTGVDLSDNARFTMSGGTIKRNITGVDVTSATATFIVSGNVNITGNTTKDVNMYYDYQSSTLNPIHIGGALNEAARIGVYTDRHQSNTDPNQILAFTDGLKGYGTRENFVRNNVGDGSLYMVNLESGEMAFSRPHTLTVPENVTVSGLTAESDGTYKVGYGDVVTLSYVGEMPAGYAPVYLVNGTAIEGCFFVMPAEDATVTVTLSYLPTYTVAGSPAALFGSENAWNINNENAEMSLVGNIYTWTSEPTALEGSVEFKVVKDHSWDVAYPSSNYTINNIKPGTYTLTVTFNPQTNEVTASLDGQVDVYVFGEINGNDFTPDEGVKMDTEDGKIYTATVNITDTEDGYSFFAFTHKLGDWNTANYYRFLAQSNGNFLVNGATMNVELQMAYNGDNAMKIPVGEYTLTVDLENMKLTIAGGTQLSYILTDGYEGIDYTIVNDLAIVDKAEATGQYFVSDGDGNWIAINAGDFFNSDLVSLKGGFVSGSIAGKNLNPYFTLSAAPVEGEDVEPVEPGVYSLAYEFAPKVNEVIIVKRAYYKASENALRAYAPGNGIQGQSLTVDTSFGDFDFVDGQAYDVQGVINIKEPWSAKAGLMDYDYPFQNYTIKVTGADEVDPSTGVNALRVDYGSDIVNVYNTNGQLIKSNVKASEATKGLIRGVYIIGNKKVIVK